MRAFIKDTRIHRYTVIVILPCLLGLAIAHFSTWTVSEAVGESADENPIVVSGNVRAQAEVEIMSQVAGRLEAIHVNVGAQVTKGQALAQLETEELKIQVRQAEAELRSAQATLDQVGATAEAEAKVKYAGSFANLKKLEMALIQAEIDAKLKAVQTETAIRRSEAHLRATQAKLKLAKSGARVQQIESARAQLEDAKRTYERKIALQKEEFASEEQVDTAKLQYDLAKAQLELLLEGSRPEDIEIAESDVDAAQAVLALYRANAMQLEVARASLESAEAQVEEARASLKMAEIVKNASLWKKDLILAEANVAKAQAMLQLAQKKLNDASIRSPIDGVIVGREFDQGATITPTSVLFTVADMRHVHIRANILEGDIPSVKKGGIAQVISNLYPNEIFEGLVTNISPIMDGKSQTAEIVVRVDNPEAKLKPGMLVRIRIPRNS